MKNKEYIHNIIIYLKDDRPAHAYAEMRRYMEHLGYNENEIGKHNINFIEYQTEARKTAVYPNIGKNLWYPALGLCGESGEVSEKIKKIYRDNNGEITQEKKNELKKELGDVLWYLNNLASELEISLEDVATTNISKLKERKYNNKLHGSGDNR